MSYDSTFKGNVIGATTYTSNGQDPLDGYGSQTFTVSNELVQDTALTANTAQTVSTSYDPDYHMYPTSVTDLLGYITSFDIYLSKYVFFLHLS